MVSLIFVSHSYDLAKVTVEYIKKVTNTNVPISFSGGSGDNHQELGTDAVEVFNAIENVYSDDGVIIFCDLGSALISSELALSMLDEEKAKVEEFIEKEFKDCDADVRIGKQPVYSYIIGVE